jgi:hypothetical protein
MRHDPYEMHGPARPDRNSDKGKENYSAPQRPLPANSSPHTCYYVPCGWGLSTAHNKTDCFRNYHSEELASLAAAAVGPAPLGHFDAEAGRHDTFKIMHRIAYLRKHARARRLAEEPRDSEHIPACFNPQAQVVQKIKSMRFAQKRFPAQSRFETDGKPFQVSYTILQLIFRSRYVWLPRSILASHFGLSSPRSGAV